MAEPQVKLNKETLEASLTQIDYLKGCKKDQITGLCKLLDNKITEEDLQEFEKLFRSLDTEEKNEMPVTQMGTCLRILQQIPTDNEVAILIEKINPKKPEGEKKAEKKPEKKADKNAKGKGGGEAGAEGEEEVEKIDFYKFILGLAIYMKDPVEIADEIKHAFKILDRSKQGYLMSANLREFLSQLGDCLLDEEIDEMIKLADTEGTGQIHYEAFVDMMTTLKPGGKKGKKGKKGKNKKKK